MGGLIAQELASQGCELVRSVAAGLPIAVWAVDLEIEQLRDVSAAELAVLRLVDAGVSTTTDITSLLGMGSDDRLTQGVLVRLLSAGAIDRAGAGFALTDTGHRWKGGGQAQGRERVTFEVGLDPVRDGLEWVEYERPIYATDDTWTIELATVDDAALLSRKAELGKLVRDGGLPDEGDQAPHERRPGADLRSFCIVSRRVHLRQVRLDFWRHPTQQHVQWIGHMGDAEHPPLTRLIENHVMREDRRRLVHHE